MKREDKKLVEKFELYRKFLEGRFINGVFEPIRIEPDLTGFLRGRYGDSIKGKRLEEMTKGQKYCIAKREALEIIKELNLDTPRRKILLEGILLVKDNPDDITLLNMVTEAASEAGYPDLTEALGDTVITYPRQLKLNFQNRKTY